ncbi:helix-turn-helix domain-containing protein [Sporosarcina sp. FSL K6-5500]|uniref:helix-turn-helix domain-containing protein n=1 Tax=Sporosarcina sp. FSL K6-5500 TaxID=2921558 RepID=UPI0030FCFDDE
MKKGLADTPERIKYLRDEVLQIKQNEMSLILNLKQGSLSDIERKKTKTVTDRVINDICREFNVSEEWLRNGVGEIFVQPTAFSLDAYAIKSGLSELETDIIKGYMGLDKDIRKGIMTHFKAIFASHAETAATIEDDIEDEVEKYRAELEAEKKGAILSASEEARSKSS